MKIEFKKIMNMYKMSWTHSQRACLLACLAACFVRYITWIFCHFGQGHIYRYTFEFCEKQCIWGVRAEGGGSQCVYSQLYLWKREKIHFFKFVGISGEIIEKLMSLFLGGSIMLLAEVPRRYIVFFLFFVNYPPP